MSSLTRFGGLDGATATLDVAVRPTAETWQVAHATAGLSALVAQRETLAPALVMREATGGVAGPLLAALAVTRGPVGRTPPARSEPWPRPSGASRQRLALMRVCWPTARQR